MAQCAQSAGCNSQGAPEGGCRPHFAYEDAEACRGGLRDSPRVTSPNLTPGLSVATDQALHVIARCLLTGSLLVKDEGSLPWLELLCTVSLNRALFSLCLLN